MLPSNRNRCKQPRSAGRRRIGLSRSPAGAKTWMRRSTEIRRSNQHTREIREFAGRVKWPRPCQGLRNGQKARCRQFSERPCQESLIIRKNSGTRPQPADDTWEMTMGFRRSDLQEAFFVAGTHPFRVPGSQGRSPRSTRSGAGAMAPPIRSPRCWRGTCFRAAGGLMHPGRADLCQCAAARRPRVSARRQGQAAVTEPGEVHMALMMVRAGERGVFPVRLVQDFVRPDDPDAARAAAQAAAPTLPAPAKRGRGRPPGSRSRKTA